MLRREGHARPLGRKPATAAGAGAVVCDAGLRREVLDGWKSQAPPAWRKISAVSKVLRQVSRCREQRSEDRGGWQIAHLPEVFLR